IAPKFPANVARHVLGIELQPIQNKARRLHHIVPDSVTRHPRNFVFSHKRWILSARSSRASRLTLGSTGRWPVTFGGSPNDPRQSHLKRIAKAGHLRQHASRVRSPDYAFARSRDATSFSAPPATINSCAAGLSGGKGNDFSSTVRIDFA